LEFKIKPFTQASNLTSADGQPAYMIETNPRMNAGMMLTGNVNVVHFDATLFYQITNAADYVLADKHVAPALERLFIASAVAVAGSRDLDAILVARPELAGTQNALRIGRERLRSDLVAEVNRRLADLEKNKAGIGVRVARVDLLPSIPAEARAAFNSVLLAMQRATTEQANARTQAESATQKANQDKDRILSDTQATADERIATAKANTAAIAALTQDAGSMRGDTLASQIYAQRIGGILKQAGEVITVTGNGGRVITPGAPQGR
jgi:regulator of protease activity HflC (stomatin/prohibitin superfamily)